MATTPEIATFCSIEIIIKRYTLKEFSLYLNNFLLAQLKIFVSKILIECLKFLLIPLLILLRSVKSFMAFGKEYYTVLSREPSRLHLFYAKNSTLLHDDEGDLDTPISIGSEAIQNAVNKNSFLGSCFIIGSIDCHPSQNGGIPRQCLRANSKTWLNLFNRHFMQTFFLAEQPSGYFILNDNLRFLERPTTSTLLLQSLPRLLLHQCD